jgi:hypothetical protein
VKYMLQIRFNGALAELEKLTTRQQKAISDEYMGISRLPGVLDSNQLQPAETARTVRVHEGETCKQLPQPARRRHPIAL